MKNEELEKLFTEWKEEHSKESQDSNTIPKVNGKSIHKDSFCVDGFIYKPKKGTVLYILAESNLGKPNKDMLIEDKDTFWFKDNYINKSKKKLCKRIRWIQEEISRRFNNIAVEDISYMNINKRGGFNKIYDKGETIFNYFKTYKKRIIEEINIIEPKVIIYCPGKTKYFVKIFEELKQEIKCEYLIYMNHPAYPFKNVGDSEYKEKYVNLEDIKNG